MDQFELLLKYQQADMELDKFERAMRDNANRKELLKLRDFLVEQQNALKKIESDVAGMSDRIDVLADEVKRLSGAVADAAAAFAAKPPEDLEAAQKQTASMQKLTNTIAQYEQELTKLRKDADARDRQQREVRVRAAKARADFDRIKVIYDEEYQKAKVKLEALRKKVAEQEEGIEPQYLEKYKSIRRHSTPPITHIHDGRCGGCNMQLPSAEMSRVRDGAAFVECENCGRIILVK